jgi:hypothetical protein
MYQKEVISDLYQLLETRTSKQREVNQAKPNQHSNNSSKNPLLYASASLELSFCE